MRKYLIGVKNGSTMCGNQGSLTTYYKARYKLIEVAESFKQDYGHDAVYLITNYTQKMCELSPIELAEYVMKAGLKLA